MGETETGVRDILTGVALAIGFLTIFRVASLVFFQPPAPTPTSIYSTPGGGEILLVPDAEPSPFCVVIGQIVTSGVGPAAADRGRMFYTRQCGQVGEGEIHDDLH